MTGASRGIGLSIAQHLASNGYSVIATSRSEMQDQANLTYLKLDMSKEQSHFEAVEFALEKFGHLDVYVNNAGYSEWKPIDLVTPEFLIQMFSLNTFGYFYGCKAAASTMSPGSSIINISSLAAKRGSSNNSAYSASKFAITGLTQSLAKELGPKGIRVNAICPVLISTPGLLQALGEVSAPATDGTEFFLSEFAKRESALKTLPSAKDVSDLCLFLASANAAAITGQSINVDCGVFPS